MVDPFVIGCGQARRENCRLASGCFYWYRNFMRASISGTEKKRGRGRPSTGIGKNIGLRLYPGLEDRIDGWRARQPDKPSRPEAIRRLIEVGLETKAPAGTPTHPPNQTTPAPPPIKRGLVSSFDPDGE
jgi:hypothetical protein